jgi:16S rRNA G966 N2-methylase RsmD
VKFIKQVAAEYDFNIAATKAMFSNFERNNATDVIFADPPYA